MVSLKRTVLLALFVVCALSPARSGAFMPPTVLPGKPSVSAPVASLSAAPQLRVPGRNMLGRLAMVSPADAISALKDWSGTPSGSRVACSTATSDAGVMAALYKEVVGGESGTGVLVVPDCERKAADHLKRIVQHLANTCSWANVAVLEDAPYPAFTFASKAGPGTVPVPQNSQESVMGSVLDWFTELMMSCQEEDEFVEIGRVLLGVKRYEVTAVENEETLQEVFWKEVQTIVEGGEGNTMIVAEKFMIKDPVAFKEFVVEKLEHPLMDWAAQGKELRVSWYHPLSAKSPSPWPIIQIYVYDPAPEAQTGEGYDDIDFEADSGMEFQKVSVDDIRKQAGLEKPSKGFGKGLKASGGNLDGIKKLDLKDTKTSPLGGILNMDELEGE